MKFVGWVAGAISLLGALEAAAIAQEIRLPLYTKGNEGERPGLYLTATVSDGTASANSTPTRIIVDTGSSQLNLPATAKRGDWCRSRIRRCMA